MNRRYFTLLMLFISYKPAGTASMLPTRLINPPRLTIICIIDQFASLQLEKIKPYLTGGINFLLKNGVFFSNAHHPHAQPATGTGHASLSTGTLALNHGIIDNTWYDHNGKEVACDDAPKGSAPVLGRKGDLYNYDRSAHTLMVDGLCDQLIFASHPHRRIHAFALSYKSRSAIPCASKAGKAIWFDEEHGHFTSSKAYFNAMPAWVEKFNKENCDVIKQTTWKLAYPSKKAPYNFDYIDDYSNVKYKKTLIGKPIVIDRSKPNPFELYMKTPDSNQLLIDCSYALLDDVFARAEKTDNIVLWLSLSTNDLLGHEYGPDSLEAIDLLYHIDKQLGAFINTLGKKYVNPKDLLFVLTSDHGITPMPEILQKKGFWQSRRLDGEGTLKEMNKLVKQKFGIANMVQHYKAPQLYLNKDILEHMSFGMKQDILRYLQAFLKKQPGIKTVWQPEELLNMPYHQEDFSWYYRNQVFPNRTGELICHVYPYCMLTNFKTGTSHHNPYHYDTHVPLMFYRKGSVENLCINNPVWAPQLTPTLALFLGVNKPSSCTFEPLPVFPMIIKTK